MTLDDHILLADRVWKRNRQHGKSIPTGALNFMREELRRDACRLSWLYPLVEARHGAPF